MTDATWKRQKYFKCIFLSQFIIMVSLQALTVIIPLFGFNYFLTLVGPDREESERWYMVFQIGRSILIRSVSGPNICYVIILLFSQIQPSANSNFPKTFNQLFSCLKKHHRVYKLSSFQSPGRHHNLALLLPKLRGQRCPQSPLEQV